MDKHGKKNDGISDFLWNFMKFHGLFIAIDFIGHGHPLFNGAVNWKIIYTFIHMDLSNAKVDYQRVNGLQAQLQLD